MLEHVPAWLGHLLQGVRAGHRKLVVFQVGRGVAKLALSSPAFADREDRGWRD